MSLHRQILFWAGALIAFVLALYVLRDILLPFVAGLAVAYFLDPVADRLERMGMSRFAATLLILLLFILLFALFIILLVPVLAQQLTGFAARLPDYLASLQAFIAEASDSRLAHWLHLDGGEVPKPLQDLAGTLTNWAGGLARSLLSGGVAVVSFLALFIVTPVVAFYMLLDWDRMVAKVDDWLPRAYLPTLRALAGDIDKAVAGFVRGQGTLCLVLGVFYAVGLMLVGLNFALLIGLGAGLISFIPYVGSTVGLVVAGGVALVQFWPEWGWIAAVIGIFAAGQFIEGNVLQPKLVGSSVGLHPVWLMFALFAFGFLFGFVGMLLAVPLAAAIGVLARFALAQYLASPLYGKQDGGTGQRK
ncbi:MAG: AI-2E family transporter [Rhodobiaceae bacterium]|nr:AI-2E family transporter [Rhodobiaceae bacterium]